MNPRAWIALAAAGLITTLGTLWAFQRGGADFAVFHYAWSLVLEGRGLEIYRNSPDRFLYAPGFAILLAPLAYIPRPVALALWCFAKAGVVGLTIREISRPVRAANSDLRAGLIYGSLAVLLLARPVLIDFQYGQVNLFILGVCAWALFSYPARESSIAKTGIQWFLVGAAAVTKLFPAPLLLVPFVVAEGISSRRRTAAITGLLLGSCMMILAPVVYGISGATLLYQDWQTALVARGLPMESHNQSLPALLFHYFSGNLTHVIFQGPQHLSLGFNLLSEHSIAALSLAWAFFAFSFLLGWMASYRSRSWDQWASVLLALVIVPGHLVWKPYFVMGIPLAAYAIRTHFRRETLRRSWAGPFGLLIIFGAVNLSGFDLVGARIGAYLEAASILMLAHLGLILVAIKADKSIT